MLDRAKLESFFTRAVSDLSAGYGGVMVSLGSKLGLYRALAGAGPLSSKEVAARAGCDERYVREWLNSQAAGGYVGYHAVSDTYELSPEQAAVLADESSPLFIPNAWSTPASMWFDEEKSIEAFRTGKGVAWGEHEGRLFCGVAAFYRNAYRASLVPEWLPALDGVVDALQAGIAVADVGCGHGHSSILMAEAFPRSRFHGFDVHPASIEQARRNAADAGVAERTSFEVARAQDYAREGYGLICFFDALHDMGDPVAAARYAAQALAPDGTVLLVEPSRTIASRTISRRSRGSTTPPRPPFAARTRSPKGARWCSAHRPARRASPRCSARPASRAFAAPPRRPST
jgi:2-polyprenyl-3-methyl-5-hydroxy-6-metoxy-1,4-benzoquinol methylase